MTHIHRTPEAIAADRARYEEHQRRGLTFAPKALPSPSPVPAPEPEAARILHREAIAPGWYWTTRLAAGEVLRIAPEARDAGIAPEARDAGIAPEARDAGIAPEARDAGIAPEARDGKDAPEARDAKDAPEARDAGKAPEAREGEDLPEARFAGDVPEAASESDAFTGTTTPVALACWSARDSSERLNLPDTVKVQWTTALAKGRVLFSDMGRVMLSITEDSSGAHDALTGGSSSGAGRTTRENMVLAAAKLGLDRRDIPALLTLFAPVRVDAAGRFFWNAGLLSGRDWVELRAEMDLLIALSTCPHPLGPAGAAAMVATRLAPLPVAADDLCRTATAEAVRGFANNARM